MSTALVGNRAELFMLGRLLRLRHGSAHEASLYSREGQAQTLLVPHPTPTLPAAYRQGDPGQYFPLLPDGQGENQLSQWKAELTLVCLFLVSCWDAFLELTSLSS